MNHYSIKRENLVAHIEALLATGLSVKDVAQALGVSEAAIRYILGNILGKEK